MDIARLFVSLSDFSPCLFIVFVHSDRSNTKEDLDPHTDGVYTYEAPGTDSLLHRIIR